MLFDAIVEVPCVGATLPALPAGLLVVGVVTVEAAPTLAVGGSATVLPPLGAALPGSAVLVLVGAGVALLAVMLLPGLATVTALPALAVVGLVVPFVAGFAGSGAVSVPVPPALAAGAGEAPDDWSGIEA